MKKKEKRTTLIKHCSCGLCGYSCRCNRCV